MRARGADLSVYQDDAHLRAAVHSGLDFAFVKATEGTGYVNPRGRQQVSVLAAAGIRVGLYHFLDAGVDGARQWDYFEANASHWTSGPVAVDYEAAGVTDQIARAFISRGHQRGWKVGLYGSSAIVQRKLGQDWTWAAWWAAAPPPFRWDVWQFAAGQHGDPDWNVFHGDQRALNAFFDRFGHYPPVNPQIVTRRKPVKPKPAPQRWWLHDELNKTALGPYRLPTLGAGLVAYLARHPRSTHLTLERS